MATKKRNFAVGEEVSYLSRLRGKKRFKVTGKVQMIENITWGKGKRKRMAVIQVPKNSVYAKECGKRTTRVALTSIL